LHRGAVDLGDKTARAREGRSIEADPLAEARELTRCLARVLPAPAADVNAELVLDGLQAALQCADDARRDARGVPVHAHDGAEGLEPEGMREPAQEFVAAVVIHDGLADDGAESRHALTQPSRDA